MSSVFLHLNYTPFVFNPVLNHRSGFPVLPAANEQRSLVKPKHHCCDQCGQRFSKMHRLRRHQLSHIEERPYLCGQSGKQFPNMLRRTSRQRMHNEETSCNPDQCGNNCRTKSNENHQGDNAIDKGTSGMPLLSLCVSAKMVTFLIDTGTTVSFLRQQDSTCCAETTTSAEMTIDLNGMTYYHAFAIQSDIPVSILGRDLLSKLNLKTYAG